MAGSSFLNKVRQVAAVPVTILAALTLAACDQGDGPDSIQNSPAEPLPDLPPGFCDPINFEIFCTQPGIVNFGGGASVVVDNPDRSGINESETVVRAQKFPDQPFGGTRLDPEDTPIDFADGTSFRMKVWSEREVPVTFKLEETLTGVGGIEQARTHTGGSEWQDLCYDFSGGVPGMPTIAFTIIFDNGVLGQSIEGIFAGDWTFYYDDITQVESCVEDGGAAVDPDAALYRTDGDADLVIPDDYSEVTAFVSGSVINDLFADDMTFMPAIAVSSGTGLGANVAQIGYIGFDAGFLSDYISIVFKAKGLPGNVIVVKLYDGVAQRRINLTSSAFAAELEDGWFQVSLPLTEFASIANATGIVLESDDTATMPFTMLLTDVGFDIDMGPPPVTTYLGVYSETNNDPSVSNLDTTFAGDEVVIDLASTAVTAFEGSVSASFTFNPGSSGFGGGIFTFNSDDASAFDSLRFALDSSAMASFANLTVQIEPPPGGDPGGNVPLGNYTPVSTTGNWDVYEIPLADFTAVTPSSIDKVAFFNARDGSDTLLGGTLYFDDIQFTDATGGVTPPPPPTEDTLGVFSEEKDDPAITLTGIDSIGNPVTIDSASMAITPFEGSISLELQFSDNTAGNGFGGITINFDDEDVSTYDALKFAIDTSAIASFANLTVQLEPPGGGTPGGNVALAGYTPVSTSGNWNVYEIPLDDFTAVDQTVVNKVGFFNARDGSDVLLAGTLYLDDIHFTTVSSGGGGGPIAGNIVPDGDFENGMLVDPPWKIDTANGVVEVSDMQANGGIYSARIFASVPPSGTPASFPSLKVERIEAGNLTPNASVTVSFDAIAVAQTPSLGATFFAELFSETMGGATNEILFGPGDSLTDSWANYSFTTNLGADVSGGVSLLLKADCGGNANCELDVYIDNVAIVVN